MQTKHILGVQQRYTQPRCDLSIACPICFQYSLLMSFQTRPEDVSSSKLRRMRAAATKQMLFASAQKADPLVSKLAMLTTTIECLVAHLAYTHATQVGNAMRWPHTWNEFAPWEEEAQSTVYESSDKYEHNTAEEAEESETLEYDWLTMHCNTYQCCWEPLPICCCGQVAFLHIMCDICY